MNKNFRTTYYKTLGVPVLQHVDVEASFSALLGENVVNVKQIVKLAMEFGIPSADRPVVWLVLAGVVPTYKIIWEFVCAEKKQIFMDLMDASKALLGSSSLLQPTTSSSSLTSPRDSSEPATFTSPIAQQERKPVVVEPPSRRFSQALDQQQVRRQSDDKHMLRIDTRQEELASESSSQQTAQEPQELKPEREQQHHDQNKEEDESSSQRKLRQRLISLHQLYWCEILCEESLHCMDNPQFLDALLSLIQRVVQDEANQFWCFVRFVQLLNQGLEVVDPLVPLESFADMTIAEFDALLLRVVDTMNAI